MNKLELVTGWLLARVGNPYLMGGTGQFCTVAYRKARAAQYPGSAEKIKKNCPRMMGRATDCKECRYYDASTGQGKHAYDCAQLTRYAMKEAGVELPSGATSQWEKTAWAFTGEMDTLPADTLCLVYRRDADGQKMAHTGVALGDGTVIHARGHDWGVVRDYLADGKWTHWAIPQGLHEDIAIPFMPLQKGDKGERVRVLQEMLLAAGMLLPRYGADGSFGNETLAAVMGVQARMGLPDTGVCDGATYQALLAMQPSEGEMGEEGEAPDSAPQAPQDAPAAITLTLPLSTAQALREALEAALLG